MTTHARKAAKRPAADAGLSRAALDALPVAFALFDAKRRLVACNARLERLGLFPRRLLAPGTDLEALRAHDKGLSGRAAKPRDLRLPRGAVLRATAQRVGPRQLLVTWEDVTEARRVGERLELVERAVSEGSYEWDIAADRVSYSERWRQFFSWVGRHGLRQGLKGREYVALVHPEDRERYYAAMLAHLKGKGDHFECEYRLSANGRTRWMRQHGTTIRDAQGRAVRMIGATADITERKEAEIALERAHAETAAALEHQTATAEVLQVISSSVADAAPVFDKIIRSCAKLFAVRYVNIALIREDGLMHLVQDYGSPDLEDWEIAARKFIQSQFPRPVRDSIHGYAIHKGGVLHYPDVANGPDVPDGLRAFIRLSDDHHGVGNYSALFAPMFWEGKGIGAIGVHRVPPAPFADKDIHLLKTFADQAAIAIQNARLFNETKEALERQTATADILKVIASSPSDAQPVFDAIVKSALTLCKGMYANAFRYDGEMLHFMANETAGDAFAAPKGDAVTRLQILEAMRAVYPMRPNPSQASGRVILNRSIVRIEDIAADPEYNRQFLVPGGPRSLLGVPMLRDGAPLGVIVVAWGEPGPISAQHEALLRTFADQAVIAIENVRLFNEIKEALERQTATAEILRVIAGSPSDFQPVFEAIVDSASRLFAPSDASVHMVAPEGVVLRATRGPNFGQLEVDALAKHYPLPAEQVPGSIAYVIAKKRSGVLADTEAPEVPPHVRNLARDAGFRSVLSAPLVREGVGIGSITLSHPQPNFQWSEPQRALLQTFADQAVIAIENTRLFTELQQKNEALATAHAQVTKALAHQTATSEILRVISGSPTNVQPAFDAIAESAARLTGAAAATLYEYDGQLVHLRAQSAPTYPHADRFRALFPRRLAPDYAAGRVIIERSVLHVADLLTDPATPPATREWAQWLEIRGVLWVPLLRESEPIGVIGVVRAEAGRFTDDQVKLLETFAAQAVIAIENVRLFKELQARTDALTKSVGQLTALGEVSQAISSTLDLDKVLQTIVSRAVQLSGLDAGAIYEYDEEREVFHVRGGQNVRQEIVALDRDEPIRLGDGPIGRAAQTRKPVQAPDLASARRQTRGRDALLHIGARALLAVPLLREGHILGALAVTRNTPGEFAPDVIALLETFAAQSAIAIQNARLFREIEDKSHQLELASQHKSQFLASMSHELRTPLNAILGFNELILGGIYGDVPEDMNAPLAQMQSSGKHLLGLINNVLDLAKIEANRMELALADYSVHDVVGLVRSTLQSLAAEKGLELAIALPEDLPLAYGDGGRLTQCLINLAGNAIKFTKQGRIEIRAELEGDTFRFSVADTGMGIAPEKIGSLFTEFKQTDAAIASEYGGTGLGLAITKKFIEMHGGRIWVESELGKGSTFIFDVPLRVDTGAAA